MAIYTVPWPTTLPQRFLRGGYSEKPKDNVIRSPVDVGQSQIRRRWSGVVYDVSAAMLLQSDAQKAAFEQWYADIAASGAIPFRLTDPLGVWRRYTLVSYDMTHTDGYWHLAMALEYTR